MQTELIHLYPEYTKFLSPQDFLNLTEDERKDIKESRIVPPKLGDKTFGGFMVKFKKPIYSMRRYDNQK